MPGTAGVGDTLQPTAPQHFATGVLLPYFLGQCLNLVLYGVSLSLYLHYRQTIAYRNDSPWLRRLIRVIVALNTLQAGVNMAQVLYWGSIQQRSTDFLWSDTVFDCLSPVGIGLISTMVQIWLAQRACFLVPHRLARKALIGVFSVTITCFFLGSVLFLVMMWLYYAGVKVNDLPMDLNRSLALMLILGAFNDCLISASLFVALRKRYTGFATATDGVLHKVIRTGLETASYTALAAVVGAVLSLAFGDNSLNSSMCMIFVFPLASLYTTSLFTTVVLRSSLREDLAARQNVPSWDSKSRCAEGRDPRPVFGSPRSHAAVLSYTPRTGPLEANRTIVDRGLGSVTRAGRGSGRTGSIGSPRLPLTWERDLERAVIATPTVDVVLPRSSRGSSAIGLTSVVEGDPIGSHSSDETEEKADAVPGGIAV